MLGIIIAEAQATAMRITAGLRAWRPAHVSRMLMTEAVCLLELICTLTFIAFVIACLTVSPYHHWQSRHCPSAPHAPSAARFRNLAKVAVAAVVVLGLETVEVLGTQTLVTRGTMGFRLAKHKSLRQRRANS